MGSMLIIWRVDQSNEVEQASHALVAFAKILAEIKRA